MAILLIANNRHYIKYCMKIINVNIKIVIIKSGSLQSLTIKHFEKTFHTLSTATIQAVFPA